MTSAHPSFVVTGGLRERCGITRFAERLAEELNAEAVRANEAGPTDRIVINFEHGVMSRSKALRLASGSDRAVVVLHTIQREKDRLFLEKLNERAYTIAMHPYAEEFVDEVVLHPAGVKAEPVVRPRRVTALGVFGLIRPGKGIEAVMNLARSLGMDVLVHGRAQDDRLTRRLEELAVMLDVGLEIKEEKWTVPALRKEVENGVLPIVPSMATSFGTIWASGTEADLLGARVPYVPYSALGGHNPCAYVVERGGPSHVLLYTHGVEEAAERAAEFVERTFPVTWQEFADVIAEALE